MHGHRSSNRSLNGRGTANGPGLLVDLAKQDHLRRESSRSEVHDGNSVEKLGIHGETDRGRRARFGKKVNWLIRVMEWLRPKRKEIKQLKIESDHVQSRWIMAVKRLDEVLDGKPKEKPNGF